VSLTENNIYTVAYNKPESTIHVEFHKNDALKCLHKDSY